MAAGGATSERAGGRPRRDGGCVCAGVQGDGLGFMKVMALTRAQLDQISEEQKKHMEVRAERRQPLARSFQY
jgi:hypothetical protein